MWKFSILFFVSAVKGKTIIRENEGLKNILKVLNKGIDLGEKEGAEFLRNVATGFLLNYLVDQSMLEKEVLIILNFCFYSFEEKLILYLFLITLVLFLKLINQVI